MAGLARRRFPMIMLYSSLLVVLTGLGLYMLRFNGDWLASPEGIVLGLGGLLGIGAILLGSFVQKPSVERMSAPARKIAEAGSPTPEQAAEVAALRTRIARTGRVIAWQLVGASLLMASHTLAMRFCSGDDGRPR